MQHDGLSVGRRCRRAAGGCVPTHCCSSPHTAAGAGGRSKSRGHVGTLLLPFAEGGGAGEEAGVGAAGTRPALLLACSDLNSHAPCTAASRAELKRGKTSKSSCTCNQAGVVASGSGEGGPSSSSTSNSRRGPAGMEGAAAVLVRLRHLGGRQPAWVPPRAMPGRSVKAGNHTCSWIRASALLGMSSTLAWAQLHAPQRRQGRRAQCEDSGVAGRGSLEPRLGGVTGARPGEGAWHAEHA